MATQMKRIVVAMNVPEDVSPQDVAIELDRLYDEADSTVWPSTQDFMLDVNEVQEEVAALRAAIARVVDAWEGGDLAGAVNDARLLLPVDARRTRDA